MILASKVWRRTVIGLCLGTLAACASASDPKPPSGPSQDAGAQATREGVLTACTDFAVRLCQGSAPCCERAYARYDQTACVETLLRELCRPGADAVAAGFASYDEQAVEPCIEAHAQANAVCVPTWQQNLSLRKSLWTACKVLRGTTEPGKGCSTAVTCAEGEGAQAGVCIRGTCRVLEVLVEGAACPFQSGTVSTCDLGLYCTTTIDEPGVCARASAEGAACSGKLGDASCGFGNYCDPVDQRCRQTVNLGGPSCRQGLECVSFDCDRASELCAPAPAIVSASECFGAP